MLLSPMTTAFAMSRWRSLRLATYAITVGFITWPKSTVNLSLIKSGL